MKKFSCRSVKLIASVCFSQNPETESNSQFQYGVETQFDKEEGLLYRKYKSHEVPSAELLSISFPIALSKKWANTFCSAGGHSDNKLMLARSFEMRMQNLVKKQETRLEKALLIGQIFWYYITCFLHQKNRAADFKKRFVLFCLPVTLIIAKSSPIFLKSDLKYLKSQASERKCQMMQPLHQ